MGVGKVGVGKIELGKGGITHVSLSLIMLLIIRQFWMNVYFPVVSL